MSILSAGRGRWLRNSHLARYMGVSNMTLWRWKRDPKLKFPAASNVNGVEWNDTTAVDEWMRQRIVKKLGGEPR